MSTSPTIALLLHGEVAAGEAVAVAEHLDGIVAGGQRGVDIPVDAGAHLLVGVFQIARGRGLHALAVDSEASSAAQQAAFGRNDTQIECLHAGRRRAVGADGEVYA